MFEMSDLKRIAPMGQLAPEVLAALKALDQSALAEGPIAVAAHGIHHSAAASAGLQITPFSRRN